jgi:Flp pilus assembly pilin Flp
MIKKLGNNGQTLVEYVLIIALISVIAISLVSLLGGYLKDSITKSSCGLVGEEYVKGAKPGEGHCEAPKQ